jgi:hypothetical protein
MEILPQHKAEVGDLRRRGAECVSDPLTAVIVTKADVVAVIVLEIVKGIWSLIKFVGQNWERESVGRKNRKL